MKGLGTVVKGQDRVWERSKTGSEKVLGPVGLHEGESKNQVSKDPYQGQEHKH